MEIEPNGEVKETEWQLGWKGLVRGTLGLLWGEGPIYKELFTLGKFQDRRK